ncbi:PREDICTED: NAC domain-containing protein 18-like [Ipomoea nil]|uniref:NAC domain-containing protein 18-like n=1 Tax=Ipomoea nil TaxID=35883 RepID=UPI00090125FE|nr:PREDICTED: NAC domain-containing protein 18-like [Ipomoea nil]
MAIEPISSVSGDVEQYSIDNIELFLGQISDEVFFRHLPPGYIFNPTDQELILEYLYKKVNNLRLPRNKINDVNLYEYNPETLCQAKFKDSCVNKEWYFFTPRNRKYRNGQRPNRAAGNGYWKATGADKDILESETNNKVGCRKALVFYESKPPNGDKTPWIMHEYRVENGPQCDRSLDEMRLDDWVLCRIYNKNDKLNSKNNNPSSKGKQKLEEDEDKDKDVVENDDDVPENVCGGGSNTSHQNHLEMAALSSSYHHHIAPPDAIATAPPYHSPSHIMWNQLLPPPQTTNIIHHNQKQQQEDNNVFHHHNNNFIENYCHIENTTSYYFSSCTSTSAQPSINAANNLHCLPYHHQYHNWQAQALHPSFNGNHHSYYQHHNSELMEALPHPTINGNNTNNHHHHNYSQAPQPTTTQAQAQTAAHYDDEEEEYDTNQFLA